LKVRDSACQGIVLSLALMGFLPIGPAWAQEAPADGQITPELLSSFSDLRNSMSEAGWQREAALYRRSAENLWRRNGWNSDADRNAMKLACDIAEIPPWNPLARINAITQHASLRYGLSGSNARTFTKSVFREAGRLTFKHAAEIIKTSDEWLRTRKDGRPISADQVAQWMKGLKPMWDDLPSVVDRLRADIEPLLDEEARRLFQEDLASFQKRSAYIEEMLPRWAEGEWKAEEWGLEEDPVQSDEVEKETTPATHEAPVADSASTIQPIPKRVRAPALARAMTLARCVAEDPATWVGCVVDLKERFGLDAGQVTTAESIHQELLERSENYVATKREPLAAVPVSARSAHPLYIPLRELHTELMERLNAIPTSAQKDQRKP